MQFLVLAAALLFSHAAFPNPSVKIINFGSSLRKIQQTLLKNPNAKSIEVWDQFAENLIPQDAKSFIWQKSISNWEESRQRKIKIWSDDLKTKKSDYFFAFNKIENAIRKYIPALSKTLGEPIPSRIYIMGVSGAEAIFSFDGTERGNLILGVDEILSKNLDPETVAVHELVHMFRANRIDYSSTSSGTQNLLKVSLFEEGLAINLTEKHLGKIKIVNHPPYRRPFKVTEQNLKDYVLRIKFDIDKSTDAKGLREVYSKWFVPDEVRDENYMAYRIGYEIFKKLSAKFSIKALNTWDKKTIESKVSEVLQNW